MLEGTRKTPFPGTTAQRVAAAITLALGSYRLSTPGLTMQRALLRVLQTKHTRPYKAEGTYLSSPVCRQTRPYGCLNDYKETNKQSGKEKDKNKVTKTTRKISENSKSKTKQNNNKPGTVSQGQFKWPPLLSVNPTILHTRLSTEQAGLWSLVGRCEEEEGVERVPKG